MAERRKRSLLKWLVVSLCAAILVLTGALFERHANIAPYAAGVAANVLGTDTQGRDVLARLVVATRTTLGIAGVAVLIGLVWVSLFGLLMAIGPKGLRGLAIAVVDVLLSFPALFIAIAVAAIWGFDPWRLAVAIGCLDWPDLSRVVRARVTSLLGAEFVRASFALGSGWARIVWRHVLPGIAPTLAAIATVLFARAIVIDGSLALVGLGVQSPSLTLGGLIADGTRTMRERPDLLIAPVTVCCVLLVAVRLLRTERRHKTVI